LKLFARDVLAGELFHPVTFPRGNSAARTATPNKTGTGNSREFSNLEF